MPDYIATKIFNGLKPKTFNSLSNHFHLGLSVPDDAEKVPSDEMASHWHVLLSLKQPKNQSERR